MRKFSQKNLKKIIIVFFLIYQYNDDVSIKTNVIFFSFFRKCFFQFPLKFMYTYRISFSRYYFLISMKHYFFLLVEIESAHARDTEMIDFTFAEARLNTNQLIKMFQYSFVHLFFFSFFFLLSKFSSKQSSYLNMIFIIVIHFKKII